MNNLTNVEATFLRDITPLLAPGAKKQIVVNLLRTAMNPNPGREGFKPDTTWTDDQLK